MEKETVKVQEKGQEYQEPQKLKRNLQFTEFRGDINKRLSETCETKMHQRMRIRRKPSPTALETNSYLCSINANELFTTEALKYVLPQSLQFS